MDKEVVKNEVSKINVKNVINVIKEKERERERGKELEEILEKELEIELELKAEVLINPIQNYKSMVQEYSSFFDEMYNLIFFKEYFETIKKEK
jgi:hypothetical protein